MQLDYGRTLMGDSLGFHIIFALLGVGIPFLISLFELIGILKKDESFIKIAKDWSFAMSVLFVTGAISGTIISTQLSALWPTFMSLAGKVIGLPFYLEAFAFFIEAIFLGIYLYSWNRFPNKIIHWLCSLPIVFGSLASAFFITTANAFMNSPQGFSVKNGNPININPIKAMLNPATPTETIHSIVSYYLTTCLLFAAIYAFSIFKKKADAKNLVLKQKILTILISLSFIFAVLTFLSGDSSAKYLAKYEPLKLAAAEALYKTQAFAPIQIGGMMRAGNEGLTGAITVPGLLSFLSYGNLNAKVLGLDAFNPSLWPPLWIHYMFDLMVFVGIYVTCIPFLFLIFYFAKRKFTFSKPILILIIFAGFLGFLAVECGWILTEVGRQPYVIKGIMTTKEAFTTNKNVLTFAYIFPTLYLVLFAATFFVIKKHYKNNNL